MTARGYLFVSIVIVIVILVIVVFLKLRQYFNPSYWHCSFYCITDYNELISPLLFHSPEGNFTIIYDNGFHASLSEDRRSLRSRSDTFQVAGLGGMNNMGLLGDGFFYEYSFFDTPPQIYMKSGSLKKSFRLAPNNKSITVDGVGYIFDTSEPLILFISNNGSVSKVDSFPAKFGITLNEVIQNPLLLSDAFRNACSNDDQPSQNDSSVHVDQN